MIISVEEQRDWAIYIHVSILSQHLPLPVQAQNDSLHYPNLISSQGQISWLSNFGYNPVLKDPTTQQIFSVCGCGYGEWWWGGGGGWLNINTH